MQAEFLRHYAAAFPALYGFVVGLLPGSPDVDDVFQQTSLVLWRKFRDFRAGSNFLAWACQVAKFEVLMHLRSRARDRHVLSPEVIEMLAEEAGAEADRREAERLALDACLASLPAAERDLLFRCYDGHASLTAIASEERRSSNSLYKWLNRVREALHDCVSRRLAGAPA